MNGDLLRAARAVLAQWDTPNWKLTEPTGKLIADLRTAVAEATESESVEISLFLDDGGNLAIACNREATLYVSDELVGLIDFEGPQSGAIH